MRTRIIFLSSCLLFFSSQISKAATCNYSIVPTSGSFGTNGGSSSFTVNVNSSCNWTAVPSTNWIHTSSSGAGNGTVSYIVDTNTDTVTRNGSITVGTKTFTISQTGLPPTLASGLDTSNLVWTTSTDYPWQVISSPSHDGMDAVLSGNKFVTNSVSSLQTTVVGPGTIGFWWKVDSDVTPAPPEDPISFDVLQFLIDGDQPDKLMGQIDWNYREFPIPAGNHTLTWQYVKDGQFNSGNDSAWLDQVT